MESSAPPSTELDADLEAAVRDAVMSLDAIRPTRAEVNVSARQGHVTLTGVVQSPMAASEIERTAASIPGVVGVTNRLLDDGTLSREVAAALAMDPRTRDIPPGYRVNSVFGRITLVGHFTEETGRAAMAVAQAVPGVREVTVKTY